MNAKHFGMLIVASIGGLAMTGIGCGDSTATGGAGGAATTGSVTATGTGSTSSKTSTGTGSGTAVTGSTGTGADCTTTCENQHAAGYTVLKGAVIQSCGCDATSPCKTQCTGNAACATPPGEPDGACSDCLTTESNKGSGSACSLAAATGATCQSNTDCAALVTCILACP
jgi:hypothetical protein